MAKFSDPRRTSGPSKGPNGYPGIFKGQLPSQSLDRPRFNINPTPVQNDQPSQGAYADSRYSQSQQVAVYGSGFAVNQFNGYWSAYVTSPSARLRISIQVLAECATRATDFAFVGTAANLGGGQASGFGVWAGSINPTTGKQTIMQQVLGTGPVSVTSASAGTAPRIYSDGYEADSAASLYLVQGICNTNDWSSLPTKGGIQTTDVINLNVVATWEPNCEISSEELKLLFAKCNVRRGGASTNNGLGLPGPFPQILNVPIAV